MPGGAVKVHEDRVMRTTVGYCVLVALCCLGPWSVIRFPGSTVQAAHADAQSNGVAALTDWLTDGGDNQRTGWNRTQKILTKDNVKDLKLLWKS